MSALRRAALVMLSLSVLAPANAFAEGASSQAAAQALFDEARQLMADGKFGEACPKLAESARLDPGAGTLLNLGHCYEKNGQTASAWVTYKDAAAAADIRHRSDWAQSARELARALAPTLSKLIIEVPPEARASGLQVRRDGVDVGSAEWGTPIPVDPGDHALEVAAPAKKTWTTVVKVGPKAEVAHVVVPSLVDEPKASTSVAAAPAPPVATPLAPAVATAPPAVDTSAHGADGSTQRVVGLLVGGVGIAGLAVGSIFGGLALSKDSASKMDCPSSPCADTPQGIQGNQENSDAKNAATVSTVALIAGGVALATGAVIVLVAPKGKSSAAVNVGPAIGAGEVGLRLGGTW